MPINLNIVDAVLTQTNSPGATSVSITAPNNIVEGDVILVCASITANNSFDGWNFDNLNITGHNFTQQEIQPLIDALAGKAINFSY